MDEQGAVGPAVAHAHAFDPDAARPLVKAIVERQRTLFASFKDLTKNDLEQEGMRLALQLHPAFNPAKGAYSTFLYTRLPNRFIDYCRSRTSQFNRERRTAEVRGLPVVDRHPNESAGPDDLGTDAPLAEWLGRLYRAIVGLAVMGGGKPTRATPGHPRTFTPAQAMAIAALMRRQNLSTRGVVQLLAEREDVRRAIQLRVIPTHSWVVKSKKKVVPNSPLAKICFD